MSDLDLLFKYNVPAPRYTSYPTVPYWNESISLAGWEQNFSTQFHAGAGQLSLYLHLPFCESLCTYCGCNKKITTNHSVEGEYIDALLAEWERYKRLMDQRPVLKELHLGGGTPTFFSPANLTRLLGAILGDCDLAPQHEFSFEGHPNNTTREHLQTLYDLGFRRVSFGVQDNDPQVQFIINRIQPFENVKAVTDMAREIGYESVNFDLIYGLPKQTPESMTRTLQQSISLRPDRVAFYSYAHVPWTSRGQRLFDEKDLPGPAEKMMLYQMGKTMFTEAGYYDIGMDHFSLPHDSLYTASQTGKLFRNFMGYTTQAGKLLIGLGVSAISDTGTGFAQNSKTVHDYYADIKSGTLPVKKGYFLNDEDVAFRKYILDVACRGKAIFNEQDVETLNTWSFPVLKDLAADGLVIYDAKGLTVTPTGRHFLRNIAAAFDLHMQRTADKNNTTKFSKAI